MASGDGARLWLWSVDPDLWNRWDDCWDFRILCSRDSKCGSDPARLPCSAHHRNGETHIPPSPKRKGSCRCKTVRERLNAFIKRSLINTYDIRQRQKNNTLKRVCCFGCYFRGYVAKSSINSMGMTATPT